MPQPSRDEILKTIHELEFSLTTDCDCAEHGHEFECDAGARIVRGQIMALKWSIGEDDGFSDLMRDVRAINGGNAFRGN